MKISTKGRYALRVMVDLASREEGVFTPLRDVAERQGITVKYLEQIIPLLHRAGYLKSFRGNAGGYRLAKASKDYTVGDILRTAEGSLSPIACLDTEDRTCDCESKDICCPHPFWEGLNKVINDYVDSVTLADLLEDWKKRSVERYDI
jgi:Rrf2 family protein